MTTLHQIFPCSCGAFCDFANPGQPCYGKVTVIEEVECNDGEDYYWIHACEGHFNGGRYEPFAQPENTMSEDTKTNEETAKADAKKQQRDKRTAEAHKKKTVSVPLAVAAAHTAKRPPDFRNK